MQRKNLRIQIARIQSKEFRPKESKSEEVTRPNSKQWADPTRKLQIHLREREGEREEKAEECTDSKVPTGLRIARIAAIRRRNAMPNRKLQNLCREIHDIDGSGGQILSILDGEIMIFQSETVEVKENGLEMIFVGDWEIGLVS